MCGLRSPPPNEPFPQELLCIRCVSGFHFSLSRHVVRWLAAAQTAIFQVRPLFVQRTQPEGTAVSWFELEVEFTF